MLESDDTALLMNEVWLVGTAMRNHGGSFVHLLGEALLRADGDNCRRIKKAFPEYWTKYLAIGERATTNENTELRGVMEEIKTRVDES